MSAPRSTPKIVASRASKTPSIKRSRLYLLLSVLAGCCASLASVFSKVAAAPAGGAIAIGGAKLCALLYETDRIGEEACIENIGLVLRVTLIILTILANIGMWALFTRALSSAPSSALVTTASSGTQAVLAGVLGAMLFGDTAPLKFQWWAGIACVVAGAAMVHSGEQKRENRGTAKAGRKED
ncbi:hypothetical protein HKX48_005250 [Thoreauomyces humboldtii]|nr:hypothetical protein HKX48_005250 [Thoreauomyces humboldtii]